MIASDPDKRTPQEASLARQLISRSSLQYGSFLEHARAIPGLALCSDGEIEGSLAATLAAGCLGAAAQTWAHHSFAATYIENQTVTIDGELVQFVLRNPHSFVDVDVTEKDGSKTRYVVEWAAPAQLAGKVDRETLKPGDHVIITGSPGRNTEDHRVRLLTFRRPKDASHAAEWTWGLLPEESFK